MAELPKWLTADAKLVYVSRSSGKEMDVVVKHISKSKKTVFLVFTPSKSEMQLPFDQILGKNNPLKLPDVAAVEDENDKFFDAMEGSWFQKTEDLDPQVSLGAEKNKFAFQGPAAPQMMEVLSSPEAEPREPRKPKKVKDGEAPKSSKTKAKAAKVSKSDPDLDKQERKRKQDPKETKKSKKKKGE
eukprot:symbB.v1.2.039265.t1/scaffold6447.1/size18026/2